MPEFDDEKQPGLLRFSGVADTDRVLVDGELVGNGSRLQRFGNRILINPGQYTVTVVKPDNKIACKSKIVVRENASVVARCESAASDEQQVD